MNFASTIEAITPVLKGFGLNAIRRIKNNLQVELKQMIKTVYLVNLMNAVMASLMSLSALLLLSYLVALSQGFVVPTAIANSLLIVCGTILVVGTLAIIFMTSRSTARSKTLDSIENDMETLVAGLEAVVAQSIAAEQEKRRHQLADARMEKLEEAIAQLSEAMEEIPKITAVESSDSKGLKVHQAQ